MARDSFPGNNCDAFCVVQKTNQPDHAAPTMKKMLRNAPLRVLAAIIAALVAASGLGSKTKADDYSDQKTPAPAWSLMDLAGNEIRSDQLKGKVVVLDFWATWCGPCRMEIPGYIELQKKYADQGLTIVCVSLDQQGPGVVQRFVAQSGINYPIVMGDQKIVEAFGGVEGIPTTFIIDRDGNIREKKVGAMPTAQFEKLLKPVLE